LEGRTGRGQNGVRYAVQHIGLSLARSLAKNIPALEPESLTLKGKEMLPIYNAEGKRKTYGTMVVVLQYTPITYPTMMRSLKLH